MMAWKGRARSDGGLDEPDSGLDGQTVAGDGLERPGKRPEGLDGGEMGGWRA